MRVYENSLHPELLRIEAKDLRGEALDSALACHPKRGFICTIDVCDKQAANLLWERGFTLVRRTFEGEWIGDREGPLPDFEYGTLAKRPDVTAAWLAAHRQNYIATHSINPPTSRNWDQVFLGADFRPDAAFYILKCGRLVAFSSLRPSRDGWEQAWFGTSPKHPRDFAALNMGLVALETEFMSKRNIAAVLVEWDSTSPDAAWRMAQYPLENQSEFLTFVR